MDTTISDNEIYGKALFHFLCKRDMAGSVLAQKAGLMRQDIIDVLQGKKLLKEGEEKRVLNKLGVSKYEFSRKIQELRNK